MGRRVEKTHDTVLENGNKIKIGITGNKGYLKEYPRKTSPLLVLIRTAGVTAAVLGFVASFSVTSNGVHWLFAAHPLIFLAGISTIGLGVVALIGSNLLHRKMKKKIIDEPQDVLWFPHSHESVDSLEDDTVVSYEIDRFPVEHSVELYNALTAVFEAEELLKEAKELGQAFQSDPRIDMILSRQKEHQENLELANERKREVIRKINRWYREQNDNDLTRFLTT